MKSLVVFILVVITSIGIYAQSPNLINYQAVIRDKHNTPLVNQNVGMQISIIPGNISARPVYTETQEPTTNAFGLINIQIGAGDSSNDMSDIDWSTGPYFLKTEIDPTGRENYTITTTQQMVSVPYALYAEKSGGSGMWEKNETDELYYENGNIGIGTQNPAYDLDIIDKDGEAYLRLRSNTASSSLIIDKFSSSQMGQIVFQHSHEPKFYTGLLGSNDYWISTDRFTLNGLEVRETGSVLFSGTANFDGYANFSKTVEFKNPIKIGADAGAGKVLTSDATGYATWESPRKTRYLSIPGSAFNPSFDGQDFSKNDGYFQGVFYLHDIQSYGVNYPIILPDGAVITSIDVTVLDNTEENFRFTVESNEFDDDDHKPSPSSTIVTFWSSGAMQGDRTFTADLTGIDPLILTISHEKVYYIEVNWDLLTATNPNSMTLEKVLVTYRY